MRTRGEELLAEFDRLRERVGVGDREVLRDILETTPWARLSTSERLPRSAVRHGVPWAMSISIRGEDIDLRVWLDGATLPTFDLDAQRWWHQVAFSRRGTRVHAYGCIPDRPELAPKPPRGWVTMISQDVDGTNRKLYTLVPDARASELADDVGLAPIVHPSDVPIGWLVCDGEDGRSLHFAAHVHGDAGLPDRLAAALGPRYAYIAARQQLHFIAWSPAKTNVYFLPMISET